jgi:hypothetical protein
MGVPAHLFERVEVGATNPKKPRVCSRLYDENERSAAVLPPDSSRSTSS